MVKRSWNRKKFLSASFNDNCLVTQRASTLKTVLFCTTRNIISCLTFFPDNNLVYSCKKTSTSHILKARCRTQARSQRWRRLRRLPDALNQAISHPCSFCIKEQQPCLWASRGLTLLLCPVSLSVLPLIDEQRQNYSNNQKEREHKETKIWPET